MIHLLLHGSWPLLDDFLEFLQVCYLYSCYPTVSKNRQTDPWETDSTLCNLLLLLSVLTLYVTNFSTWKSICCKCSRSSNLLLAGNCCFWEFLSAAGVICSHPFWKQFFYTSYNVLMFTWYLCIFLKGALNLEPRSVVCPATSSLVLVTCSNVFFS